MTRFMARAALGATASICVLAVLATAAVAAPADPNVIKTLRQPDGSTVRVHLWGDEFAHGYETTDGYTVAFDPKDKTWKYAQRDAKGQLQPSNTKARSGGRGSAGKHLRPTTAAINEERKAQGAPAIGEAAATAPPWAGSDTDTLFLMVEFTDTGCTFTPTQMQTNMFGGGASGPGDLDDFFDEISYGDLQVVGTVTGNQAGTDCIALANNRAYYNTGAANREEDVVREAVNAANSYVNFADYDNDNNGTVDALGIIYAGGGPHDGCATDAPPSGSGGDNLWPHSGAVDTGSALTADGKTLRPYIMNSEVTYAISNPSNCNQMQTIGLFAHELGHSLGLPDLYDTDVGNGGVDTWSTMASQYVSTTNNADTPPHYDPWSKAFEGWVTPTVHQPGDRFIEGISQAATNDEVHQFRDNPSGFQIGGSGQYFLVENRQRTAFDGGLAGCGLLVWHIDEAQTGNQNGGHTAGSHRLVDIDEADGLAELDANGNADAGDPFPGSTNNRLFGDGTNPSTKLYDGSSSNVRMYVQSASCASTMNAAFGPNQAPNASAGGPYATDEGTNVTLTAAGSDPDSDPLTYEWDLDNDGDFDDSTSQTPTFTNVGDNGVFTVKVKVSDNFGDSDTDSTTVTINNVKPTVTSLSNTGPKPENTAVSISGSASDAGWLDVLTATVDWGDGAGPQPLAGTLENNRPDATLTFEATHTYGDNGTFTVTVCASDDDGATSDPCKATNVSITNVDPTAAINEDAATDINGTNVLLSHAGESVAFKGRSTDPGSDDLTLSWDWDDGGASPDVTTKYRVNLLVDDPFPSPSVQPRDVTDEKSHAFGDACVYDVEFSALDDDSGSASDTVKVLITGNEDDGQPSGYWAHQYRQQGRIDFDDATLACYLEIAGFVSKVFNEKKDVSTFDKAQRLLFSQGAPVSKRDQLARDLLTAWLNFANGAVEWNEQVDTNGDGTPDTPFYQAMQTAETVHNDANATPAQLDAQRAIIQRINDTI